MKLPILSLATSLALLPAVSLTAFAQDTDGPTFTNTELRGGVVMMSTGVAPGNLAVLPGEDGVFLVDDRLPGEGSVIQAAIEEFAGPGVPRFILNTHYHGDHVGSNAHFHDEGSTIVAHHNIRARLEDSDDEWAQADGVLPILTFGQDITFHMNGQTVQAVHVPAAHTDGDAIVYFREADVLHMGDVLFNGIFPFVDLAAGGSFDGYIAGLERGLEIAGPETQIIPGHGELATRSDIETSIDMLNSIRPLVADMVADGMTLEAILEADPLAEFTEDWSWFFICTPRMTTLLFNEASNLAENWPDDMSCRRPAAEQD